MTPLLIAIGFDSREPLTLQVLAHSIIRRASKPVMFLPIALNHVKDVYTRTDARATTEFSLTRFLSPWLASYQGWVLFLDSDMLVQTDIYTIFDAVLDQPGKSVYVCQHDYVPKLESKATGTQTQYVRKNWSSAMLLAADQCRMLTPAYVNTASPADLHRFVWMPDERIGSLPLTWNWLCGEYPDNPDAQNLHYTLGAPAFSGYESGPMADVWWAEYRSMLQPMRTYALPEAEVYAKATGAVR